MSAPTPSPAMAPGGAGEPLTHLDHFAELLSRGLTMPQIRGRMGLSNGAAQGLMRRLREGLGWQAQ